MSRLNPDQRALLEHLHILWDKGGGEPNGVHADELAQYFARTRHPVLAGCSGGALQRKLVRLEARGLVRRGMLGGRTCVWYYLPPTRP